MIYENGDVSMMFSNYLSHMGLIFLLMENNLLAGDCIGSATQIMLCFLRIDKIVSLGVLSICTCVHMCVTDSKSQLVEASQSDSLPTPSSLV